MHEPIIYAYSWVSLTAPTHGHRIDMTSYQRSRDLFLNNAIDELTIIKMMAHVLDSFCSLLHLSVLFDRKNRIAFDTLQMKVFLLAVKKLADIGLGRTAGIEKQELREMYPDALYLIEEAFPNDRRSALYGNDVLSLHWSLIVQDHLTIEELRKTMTEGVYGEAKVKPEVQ